MNRKVMIAINEMDAANQMKQVLAQNGFHVLSVCTSGSQAIQKVRMLRPDLLIVNFELPDTTGLEVAKLLAYDKLCTVILLMNKSQTEYAESFRGNLDVVCLNKPFNRTVLIRTIDLILSSKQQIKRLEAEVEDLKEDLETRKMVDRAKGLLMKKLGLSEMEAHRKIQKQSMDHGKSIRDVAKNIIETL